VLDLIIILSGRRYTSYEEIEYISVLYIANIRLIVIFCKKKEEFVPMCMVFVHLIRILLTRTLLRLAYLK